MLFRSTLPQSRGRDLAVQSFAQQIARTDPANASRWVDTIQDDQVWQNAAQSLAWQWVRIDPGAAKAWVAQSSLPDDFKRNLANQK